jgi:hypothetical protein
MAAVNRLSVLYGEAEFGLFKYVTELKHIQLNLCSFVGLIRRLPD